METIRFKSKRTFERYLRRSPVHARRVRHEQTLAEAHRDEERYELEALCAACNRPSLLLVDRLYGARETAHGWQPNWRERLVCRSCQLNNRQRAMIHVLRHAVTRRLQREGGARLYAMEQVTPLFDWLWHHLPLDCVGSEYLGPEFEGGSHHEFAGRAVRHENAQALSLESGHFDFVVSNDVLEHVDQPRAVIGEMMRILKPGGELFLTVPFYEQRSSSRRRAGVVNGRLEHLLPEEYHGNPLSEKGSLVFYDFGWDLLYWLRASGFREVSMQVYWSDRYGYLGDPQFYFYAVRPGARLLPKGHYYRMRERLLGLFTARGSSRY